MFIYSCLAGSAQIWWRWQPCKTVYHES